MSQSIAQSLIEVSQRLNDTLRPLEFSAPWTYRPLDYAWAPQETYIRRFGNSTKRVLMLGMNPGPYGMSQTGIPFGEIPSVRDWMGIEEPVGKPDPEHPKRPIEGFECQRSEVSGRRLWGLFSKLYPKVEDFFAEHYVLNFCPLVWMKETGANITPDKLPAAEMEPVEECCMRHLREVIGLLDPEFLVGVGGFAEKRLRQASDEMGGGAIVGRVLHPSPASPAANRGWAEAATAQLEKLGVW
ncbi:MAG: uracil-DNA glycosylase family protein [Luteolibacter sp.]